MAKEKPKCKKPGRVCDFRIMPVAEPCGGFRKAVFAVWKPLVQRATRDRAGDWQEIITACRGAFLLESPP